MSTATHRALLPTTLKLLARKSVSGKRPVRARCSTPNVDRMGDIVEQNFDLTAFKNAPTILWNHDPNVPIARATDVGVSGGALMATMEFPEKGADADSDRIHAKIAAGVVNAISIGFRPLSYEPVNRNDPYAGIRFLRSEILEISCVSVAANPDCVIVSRAHPAERSPKKREPVNLGLLLHEISFQEAVEAMDEDALRRAYAKRDRGTALLGGIPCNSPWFR
jgi:HK97 family phage prohead protease